MRRDVRDPRAALIPIPGTHDRSGVSGGPSLIAITGLCGSGKSRYIRAIRKSIPGLIADDYMAHAHGERLADSRSFVGLVRALNAGKDCLVCDIAFCRSQRRADFEDLVRRSAPGAAVEWRYFANDPQQCLRNVRARVRIHITREEQSIRELTLHYQIPEGATVLPVWRPPDSPVR